MQTLHRNLQQQVNEYFQTEAAYWKSVYSADRLLPTIYQERHNTALEWIQQLGFPISARILEVGCGAGLISLALARKGHFVDALDSTTAMLHMTRSDAVNEGLQDRIRIHVADVHALPFDAQTFDLVIAIGVLPWLHSERLAVQEMQRVLKPGGQLLVTADNNARLNRLLDPLSSPLMAPLRFVAKGVLRRWGWWSPKSGLQPKRHYPREVHRLLHECCLENLKSESVGFGPFTLVGREIFEESTSLRIHRNLQKLASKRGISPLRRTGLHYMVLATKP
jgi:2-polyprenyl-3-methyl-5-hydroxy-6-metoxy-1,4-benzoquinol methylase